MICPKCGTNNAEGVAFCANCGTAMENTPVQPAYNRPAPAQNGKGLAIASMVLGIVSLIMFALIAGTLAVVFGAMAKKKGYTGGMATAGLVLGVIGLATWLLMMIFCSGCGVAGLF